MTRIETARVHEMLGLQIGAIRDLAARLDTGDLELLESVLAELDQEVAQLRSMLTSLPHRH
jgi:DNA-binding transcriptional MerR regulator